MQTTYNTVEPYHGVKRFDVRMLWATLESSKVLSKIEVSGDLYTHVKRLRKTKLHTSKFNRLNQSFISTTWLGTVDWRWTASMNLMQYLLRVGSNSLRDALRNEGPTVRLNSAWRFFSLNCQLVHAETIHHVDKMGGKVWRPENVVIKRSFQCGAAWAIDIL